MIPYASRTVDIILHPDCPLPKKGAKDVINLLKLRKLSGAVEAVVQLAPERYRLTFNHARQMHAFSNQDLLIHGKPVEFKSVSPFTWVYISRLSYGVPDETITRALAPYSGGIKSMKSVMHENIYTGEHNVLMKITANIPARLRIAGHWCVVKYSGQKPVCFKCHKEGHVIADCPTSQRNNNNNTATTSSTNNNNATDLSVPVAPSLPVISYAAVARSNLPLNAPSESTNGPSTPLTNNNQSAPDCASGVPVSSAPSAPAGRGSTAERDTSSVPPTSPVRRRGKRRHPPTHSPQPEEKRAAPDDEEVDDLNTAPDPVEEECPWSQISTDNSITELAGTTPTPAHEDADSRPETVPLPHDTDDDGDDDENNETDMDNDNNQTTDEDGDNKTENGQNEIDENNEDDDENHDTRDSEVDQMDPDEYLDLSDDGYPSDDNGSFATVSEVEMPNSPAPHMVSLSISTTDTTSQQKTHDEPAVAVAHDADALFKLAAVLPTQGDSPSF